MVFFLFFLLTATLLSFSISQVKGQIEQLHTDGINIYNENNDEVFLISTGADYNEWKNGFFTATDVAAIKNNGGNCVEMHTNFVHLLMPTRDTIDAAYVTNYLDMMVNLVTGEDLYLIINLQDVGIGSYNYMPDWMLDGHGYGTSPYSVDTRKIALKDFYNLTHTVMDDNRLSWIGIWEYIADCYKDNPYVLFSLVNEPMNADLTFATGERATFGQYYATFMENTVDAIRATGAQQLIFIDKPYSASDWTDVIKVNRDNVVWEDHMYIESGHEYAWWASFVSESVNRFVTTFNQPLFIGEYATIPLNRTNWQTDMEDMAIYLNDTSKFCGRSFHSWGMLYGEYDSADANPGALSSVAENNILINIIFGNNPLPAPTPTLTPTPTSTTTSTPTTMTPAFFADTTPDVLASGNSFNILIEYQGGIAFQHNNIIFYIEVLSGVWDGRDCQLQMNGRGGSLYFVSYNDCAIQLYHNDNHTMGLTIEGAEVDTLNPVPPTTGDYYKGGYEWNATITNGAEVRINWNFPTLLPHEENWMLYVGIAGLIMFLIGIGLTVYAFRNYKIFTLKENVETIWDKEILPVCIILLIFGFGLLITWLLAG